MYSSHLSYEVGLETELFLTKPLEYFLIVLPILREYPQDDILIWIFFGHPEHTCEGSTGLKFISKHSLVAPYLSADGNESTELQLSLSFWKESERL